MLKSLKLFTFLSISALLLCAGCSIFPKNQDIPVTYFDIGTPGQMKALKKVPQVSIQDVRTMEPYNERMVFRTSETLIEIDEYNRWASSPEEMIKKYFILAFNQNDLNKLQLKKDGILQINAQILCLESDLTKNTVKVSMSVEIRNFTDTNLVYSGIMTEEQNVDNITAQKFSETVKILVDKMLIILSQNINALSK